MDIVNLYIHHTVKGPGKRDGAYAFVLEYVTDRGNATYSKTGFIEGVTEKQAEIMVLKEAVERLKWTCVLSVYTGNYHVFTPFEKGWIDRWRENGWMTAKKKPVANREEWEKLASLLERQQYRFFVGKRHSYLEWLMNECKKGEKNGKSRNDNENKRQ